MNYFQRYSVPCRMQKGRRGAGFFPMAMGAIFMANAVMAGDLGIELGAADNLVVLGTNGTVLDPDVHLHGYVSVGIEPGAAQTVTGGAGSVFIRNQVEIGSNTFVRGRLMVGSATSPDTLFSVATNAFQVNATGDLARVRSVPYSWPATQGRTNTLLYNTGNGVLAWSNPPVSLVMHASANYQWANMPAALTEFGGGNFRCRTLADLSLYTQFRLLVTVTTVGSANAQIRAQYSTDGASWSYLDGATNPVAAINTTGFKITDWLTLDGTARAEVYLRLVGIGGNGSADPRFGILTLQFR
jgi:hypothetical protein